MRAVELGPENRDMSVFIGPEQMIADEERRSSDATVTVSP